MNHHPTLFSMTCDGCGMTTLHRLTPNSRSCVWCQSQQLIETLDEPEVVRVEPTYKINIKDLNFSDDEDEELVAEEIEHT